ncbi:MAG: hypothetical protein AAGD96_01625 [Chloroflexota bacterium]
MSIWNNTNNRFIGRISVIACLLFTALFIITVQSQAAYGQTQNLLLNGDFEEGYRQVDGFETAWVAVGWEPFAITTDLDIPNNPNGSPPVYLASDSSSATTNRSLTGSRSQMWRTNYSAAFAGVYQRVPIPEESTVRLSAWTFGWSSTGEDPSISQNAAWMRQRIGIDPTGGTDPTSEDIIWSPAAQYIDTWGELSVEVKSQAEYVTVFLSAYPNFVLPNNEIHYDSARLRVVAYELPTPAPDYGVAGDEVPGAAPTIDPLLIGLVTGQGVSAGQQGIILSSGSAVDSDIQAANRDGTTFISWRALFSSLILIMATGFTLVYLLQMRFQQLEEKQLKKAEAEVNKSQPPKDH